MSLVSESELESSSGSAKPAAPAVAPRSKPVPVPRQQPQPPPRNDEPSSVPEAESAAAKRQEVEQKDQQQQQQRSEEDGSTNAAQPAVAEGDSKKTDQKTSNPSKPSPELGRRVPPLPPKQSRPLSSVETGRDYFGNSDNMVSSALQNSNSEQEGPAPAATRTPPPTLPRSKPASRPAQSQPAADPGPADSESTAGTQQQKENGLQGEKLENGASMQQQKQQQQQQHDSNSSESNQSAEQIKRSPGPTPSQSPSPRPLRRAMPPHDKPLRPTSSVDSGRESRPGSDLHSSLLWRRSMSLTPAHADVTPLQSPAVKKSSPASPVLSNHPRRLRSGFCRESWVLPRKTAPQQPSSTTSSTSSESDVVMLSLAQLVEEHSRNFPIRATVVSGLEDQLPAGTAIDIHFLKQAKVVDISDHLNQRHVVPLNSSIQFGLIYCPGIKAENFFFEKVSDIIHADDLPKVVTCTKKIKSKHEESSLAINEVLIILGIDVAKSSKKPKLKVFSCLQQKEKILPGDLVGRFTTDPKLAKLHLPDILQHLTLPVSAHLFVADGTDASQLECLTKGPVVLLDTTVETSLVASFPRSVADDTSGSDTSRSVVDVPISKDIRLGISYREEPSSLARLRVSTRAVWADLTAPLSEKTSHPRVLRAGDGVQHALSSLVRAGWEREGQGLRVPPQLKKELGAVDDASSSSFLTSSPSSSPCGRYQVLVDGPRGETASPFQTTSLSSDYYSTADDDSLSVCRADTDDDIFPSEPDRRDMMTTEPRTSKSGSLSSPLSTTPGGGGGGGAMEDDGRYNPRLVRRIEALEMRISGAAPQDKVQRLTRRLEALELRLPAIDTAELRHRQREEALEKEVGSLREMVGALREQVQGMEAQMKEMALVLRNAHHQNTREENQEELKTMTAEQVLKLLDVLGLGEYRQTFQEERMSGDILAECDEEVLSQDLGISQEQQRFKLLRVIRGEVSPLTAIAEDSYVKFKANQDKP